MIELIVEWLFSILFIMGTRIMAGKKASDPIARLRALWMFVIGGFFLIIFALFLGAWRFIIYFDLNNIRGMGLLVSQSVLTIYDIRGIIYCRREIHEIKG